jgi:predicted glutamine amidotransferase
MAELLGPDALDAFTGLSRVHADGWGLAWLGEDNRIKRVRGADAAHSSRTYKEAVMGVQARAAIMHLRWATAGLNVRLENTHPFVSAGSAFAHNGAIMPFEGISELLTPTQRAKLEGDTDSERYFTLLSAARAEFGPVEGIRRTVQRVNQGLTASSLNAMLLTGTDLTVISCHDPASAAAATPAPTGPGEADGQGYFELFAKSDATSTVVASSAWGRRGWDRLANGVVARIDVETNTVHLDEIAAVVSQ